MQGTRVASVLFSLLIAGQLAACAADGIGGGAAGTAIGGKADTAAQYRESAAERDVTVEALEGFVPAPELLAKPGRRVVSTPDAFRRFFGVEAPAEIDFDRQWVVFFTPGPQDDGQYGANVDVTVHASGRSLRIRRDVLEPGRGCFEREDPATAYFVGTFTPPEGIRPQSVRYFTKVDTHDCGGAALCGGPLTEALTEATILPDGDELTYMSEADYPFVPVDLGELSETAEITTEDVARRAIDSGLWEEMLRGLTEYTDETVPEGTDAIVARIMSGEGYYWRASAHSFDGFFGYRSGEGITDADLAEMDEWDRNEYIGYRQINAALTSNLSDIRVFRYFDVEVHILIVGRTACGHLAGYETISIET